MAELVIKTGKLQGKRLILGESNVLIGRDERCQIRIPSHEVSRQHCALRSTAEGILVRDMASRNGTFINDMRIERETFLRPGDLLRVGSLVFELPAKRSPQTAPPSGPPTGRGEPVTTEDAIASWLTGDTEAGQMSTEDTTVIETRPATAPPPVASPDPPAPPKKKFKTLAEEAADIIRRHQEQLATSQASDGRT